MTDFIAVVLQFTIKMGTNNKKEIELLSLREGDTHKIQNLTLFYLLSENIL